MNFYSVRDLRIQPKQIWKKLTEEHEVIITNNGKPSAIMLDIDDENIEDVLAGVRQTMAKLAVNKIRLSSRMNGNYKMSESEIETEIADSRKSNKL